MRAIDLGAFALTALARHRVRTGMSLLGVAIGVASVVALTGLGEGARRFVAREFGSLGANLLSLVPGKNETSGGMPIGGAPNDLTIGDARALQRGLRSLQVLAPLSMGNETVSHQTRRRQVRVLAATHDFLKARELKVARGSFLPPGDMARGGPSVVIGAGVAEELFPNGGAVGRVVRVGESRMRVIGELASVGTQMGFDMDDLVIVPLATGMRMFNRTSLARVLIKTHSHEDIDRVCERAVAIITERHREEDVTCITQASVVASLSTILGVLTLGVAGIAGISLLVAGIGIMNVMLVSVSERTDEVGLLKATGARNHQILGVFLAEAVLLAGLGGIVGVGIGWLSIRWLAWYYPAFPATTPVWAAVAAMAIAVGVGAGFGVLPARRATRLDPVAALAGH